MQVIKIELKPVSKVLKVVILERREESSYLVPYNYEMLRSAQHDKQGTVILNSFQNLNKRGFTEFTLSGTNVFSMTTRLLEGGNQ